MIQALRGSAVHDVEAEYYLVSLCLHVLSRF